MRVVRLSCIALLLSAAMLIRPASALTLTQTYAFSATFDVDYPTFNPAPFPSLSGTVTLTFDPTQTQAPVAVDSFTSNLPSAYSPVFFDNFMGFLEIGNECNSSFCDVSYHNDTFNFNFSVDGGGAVTNAEYFDYSTQQIDFASSTSFSVSAVPSPVPEPVSVALLGSWLVGAIAVRHRRGAWVRLGSKRGAGA